MGPTPRFAFPPGVVGLYLALPWGGVLWIHEDPQSYPTEDCDFALEESRVDVALVTMGNATEKREAFDALVALDVVQRRG